MSAVRIRRTPGGSDDYGDPVASTETTLALSGLFAPDVPDVTDPRARDGEVVKATFYADLTADVVRSDLIEVDGYEWTVEGTPQRWTRGNGMRSGLVIHLRRAAG